MSCSCSCSCCCCVSPSRRLLEGMRKKEQLVREEEEEEEGRRKMELSVLREQYRSSRDSQRRHTQVLLFRTVSDELSEAVSFVPVAQGLTSPPALTFDPRPTTFDPWHVHLDLHRRCCPAVTAQLAALSPETTENNSSSRRSWSSSEAVSYHQDVDSTSDSPSSSRETSPCSSFNRTKEEEDSDTDRSRGDPEQMDPVRVAASGSVEALEQNPGDGAPPAGSLASSDESSTPIACSPSSSTTSLHQDLRENRSVGRHTRTGSSAWRGSRKVSAPTLRFTRQLSEGGVGSAAGVHQGQNYHPFPHRKPPRISEAARRLGMYSSF